MQFYDSSGKSGIVDEVYFLTNNDTTSYPLAEVTRNVNRWLDVVVSDILNCDGRWQWDDTNHTTLPIAAANLVANQEDYAFDSSLLQVERIEAKDTAGNWVLLSPLDLNDIRSSFTEFQDVPSQPTYFDVLGSSIILKPAPSYNSTGGLKVYFKRKPDYFTASDTTQEPGFAAPYHRILSLGGAYDWMVAKNVGNAGTIRQELEALRNEMKKFYQKRSKYEVLALKRFFTRYK